MSYVPSSTEYVAFVSYQQATQITHNSSLFGAESVFELPQLNFKIFPTDIIYELVVQPPEPRYSGSTEILQLTLDAEARLVDDLQSANTTKIPAPFVYDDLTIHELLMQRFGDKAPSLGYMSIVKHHLILSNDMNTALQDVEFVLDQNSSNAPTLFDNVTVRQAVYATGVTDQTYVGLFVGMFPTQLNDTRMAAKSIISDGNSITVSRALLFPTPDIALGRLGQAHEIFQRATSYRILDSWMVVSYDYPLVRLPAELTGI